VALRLCPGFGETAAIHIAANIFIEDNKVLTMVPA
jgi:hypothetical protein